MNYFSHYNWLGIGFVGVIGSSALLASPFKIAAAILMILSLLAMVIGSHFIGDGYPRQVNTTIHSNDQHLHFHKHYHQMKSMQEGVEIQQQRPDGTRVSIRHLRKFE